MSLIVTIGGENSNSYVPLEEANTYLTESRLYATEWSEAPGGDLDREAALRWATVLIDSYFNFHGTINTKEQALRWPRYGAFDSDNRLIEQTLIPVDVKNATAELAYELIKRDRSEEPGLLGQGFREAKIGSLEVKLDDKATPDMIPPTVVALLTDIGTPNNAFNAKGDRAVRVGRG